MPLADGLYLEAWNMEHGTWNMRNYAGELNAKGLRFGVVVNRFNAFITERLREKT